MTLEEQVRKSMNKSRGRMAGLIESWGLDEHREHAMIQIMKSLSYDAENEIVELIKQQ